MENQSISELIWGFLSLQADSYISLVKYSQGLWLAIIIVLLAGISLGIGQGIILFINQVKQIRFVFSILLNAILFTFGFIFLVGSTWLNLKLPWSSINISFSTLVIILGVSYVPQLFGFLGALPYLGIPILSIISVWRLLAMVVGLASVTQISISQAFWYLLLGWLILHLLENTFGKPIAKLGKKLANQVAGVEIARNRSQIVEKIRAGIQEVANPIIEYSLINAATPETNNQSQKNTKQNILESATEKIKIIPTDTVDSPLKELEKQTQTIPQPIKLLLSFLGMLVLFIAITIALKPIYNGLLGWHQKLPSVWRLVFNLGWMGVIATVFAGILAPLETLGWWAGWYEDTIEVTTPNQVSENTKSASKFNRYVIYLDGIGQSGYEYTPDVETFLKRLQSLIPPNIKLIKGLMMYSVLNKPLDEDRPLAFFWRLADRMRFSDPKAILGIFLNLRNVLIVAVSADKRYGPIYHLGIAQILCRGLLQAGYQPQSGVKITLIGYSGGGEMSAAAAPYLREALGCPIEVISLGGVISAKNNLLRLEHLYHLVGDKDYIERIGPVIFPGRWKIYPLSYWNRAKRRGLITILSLGPVGHQVPGGMMDDQAYLDNGTSYLDQTIGTILAILQEKAITTENLIKRVPSNYTRYQQAEFISSLSYYPLLSSVDKHLYHPNGDWIGRLILPTPEERNQIEGVWLEVEYSPPGFEHLIGQRVQLSWSQDALIQKQVKAVTKDVYFSADAKYSSKYGGLIHPTRLNNWRQVNSLESLAGSRPVDDMIVSISTKDVEFHNNCLFTKIQPLQITGRYYAVVTFLAEIPGKDQWRVRHFNRVSGQFDGPEEIVSVPPVISDVNGCFPSTSKDLDKSPLNSQGWYIYGAKDLNGLFVVSSWLPRSLLRLQPQQLITSNKQGYQFIRKQAWSEAVAPKGKIASVLIDSHSQGENYWQIGDRALLIHVYGGIGGKKREPAAATPIFFGHFAYGSATVIKDPLTGELRFQISYYQVYTHNSDGLIAGKLDASRYLGDRQFGWAGTRPTCDLLIKFEPFTGYYQFGDNLVSPLNVMMRHLSVMTARYRIGDGTGGTYVGPANNCAQDSNQALFASIADMKRSLENNTELREVLSQDHRFDTLLAMGEDLEKVLQPLGRSRQDWSTNEFNLGSTLEDRPLVNLWSGLASWRTMLPRYASDSIVRIFLKYGASVWVLRTNQIGGHDPDIEAISPITL